MTQGNEGLVERLRHSSPLATATAAIDLIEAQARQLADLKREVEQKDAVLRMALKRLNADGHLCNAAEVRAALSNTQDQEQG